jgi:hypothetical protein
MPAALVPRKGIGFRGILVSYLKSSGASSFRLRRQVSNTVKIVILFCFIIVLVLGFHKTY